jgi:hypothetical protein
MLLINVYHGCQILKTSHGTDYDIQAACTFSADEAINLRDLKRQVHADLELLPSQFNINISARINTAPAGSSFFYSLFGVVSDEIWGMIKTTAPYHLLGYKTLELVVESELISNSDNYDPTSIPGSSNPVMAEERTHSRAREQRPSRVSVQNVDVDVDEDDEEEELPYKNVYKNCHINRIKTLFKQTARHKKPWRCEEYIKKLTVLDRHLINSSEKRNHARKSPNGISVQQKDTK